MHDAHIHIKDDVLLETLMTHQIAAIANASDPKDYCMLKEMQSRWKKISISVGIHPWKIHAHSWEEMLSYMEEADLIGEIGLDNVWCETDMDQQIDIFHQSLHFASVMKKPVILHIKGMEQEAFPILRQYPNTYLVHWYSCHEYLDEYIKLGCYFTIGPSVGIDEAVTQVARTVSLDRMMIETDGLDALSWCDQRTCTVDQYFNRLKRSVEQISAFRNIDYVQLQKILDGNFSHFLQQTAR